MCNIQLLLCLSSLYLPLLKKRHCDILDVVTVELKNSGK